MKASPKIFRAAFAIYLLLVGGCGENQDPSSNQVPKVSTHSASEAPQPPGEELDSLHIEITGKDYRWSARYPGEDRQLGTADDVLTRQEVHVPVNAKTQIDLKSGDFIYTFALPHWGLKEIAVPDMTFTLHLVANRAGSFELLGDQMCGYAHPELLGKFTVQSQEDFSTWLAEQRSRR